MVDINLIFPLTSGILLALANFFIKIGLYQTSSLSITNILFNKILIVGIIFGFFGGLLLWYSLKILPLWMVILTINIMSTIGSILLGVFILNEFISPMRSILIILTISLLVAVLVVK